MEWNGIMESWNGMESWNHGIMESWNKNQNIKELKYKMRNYGYIQVYNYIINHTPNFYGVVTTWISRTDSWFYVFWKNIIFIRGI